VKAVKIALEDRLLVAVDRLARRLKMTRSAFARDALRYALTKHRAEALERKHRLGYLRHPVKKGEFDAASKARKEKRRITLEEYRKKHGL
jgi:metal-responsive CopG/Arc/MetJ family transcriptional regulator